MSLVLNMVGGGSGGVSDADAILRVQALAGSIVTITKGTVTKTDYGHENATDATFYDYYFLIKSSQFDSVNPWTVTATLSNKSKSQTIVINENDDYFLLLVYRYDIIKDGIFVDNTLVKYQGNGTEVTGSGYRIYKITDNNWTTWYTDTEVDVTYFSSMFVVLTGGITRYWDRFGLRTTKTALSTQNANIFNIASVSTGASGTITTITEPTTLSTDITAITGSYWFGFTIEGSNNVTDADYSKGGFKVTDIYFE